LLLVPVQTHVLPLWQIPLYGIVGGVFLCLEPLDKVLGVFNSGEADKLAPQAQAPLLAMNAAAPLLSAVDGIAPVELVEERVRGKLTCRPIVSYPLVVVQAYVVRLRKKEFL
jgi:predicted DNA repair protein MutK